MRNFYLKKILKKPRQRGIILSILLLLVVSVAQAQITIFSENWSSSSFTTNGWTFSPSQGNWVIGSSYVPTGGTAPDAEFSWSPQVTNYSYSLVSPVINGTSYVGMKISYKLSLNNYSTTTLEQMKVEYKKVSASTWTTLTNYDNSTGSLNVAPSNVTLSGTDTSSYQIRFTAYGQDSYNINGWGLDDIVISGTPSSSCTGTPIAGTAAVNLTNICAGTNITLIDTGYTIAAGIVVKWQSANASTGPWTDIVASYGLPTYTAPCNATTYYRAKVVCSNSDSSYSNSVLVTVAPLFPAGTYTVNPASPASSTNFQSISAAISAITCGISGPVVFNLAANTTFNEQVTIPAIMTAVGSNTITINGNNDTLTFLANSAQPWTLGLNGGRRIIVNNLIVQSTDVTYALAAHLWNNADSNVFSNCTFICPANGTSSYQVPFSVSGSSQYPTTSGLSGSGNLITGCTMLNGYYSTVFAGNSTTPNVNNTVLNCNILDFYYYGSYNLYQNGITIQGCNIQRPTRTAISSFYGLYVSSGCTNANIIGNKVHNPFGGVSNFAGSFYGIYSTVAGTLGNENKFINNVLSNDNGNSATYGMYLSGATNIKVYYNTIAHTNISATTTSATYGIYSTGTSGVDIKNNIVSISTGGTGTKYCLYFTGAGKTSNYNDLYMNAAAGTSNNIGYYSAAFATLANWQTANSAAFDQNSVSLNPMFVNPVMGDFTPGNAALDNLGTPITGVTTDINNATRSTTTPDMGAYEFSVPPCFGTPTAGTASSLAGTSVCAGVPFTLGLSGFTIASGITIQWQSSPAGAATWSNITNATNSSYTSTGITSAMDYQAVVTCSNGGGQDWSNTVSLSMKPFYVCYCSPLTGVSLNGSTTFTYLTKVQRVGGSLNDTLLVGGYHQHYPTTTNTTDSLMQGVQYTLQTTHYYTGTYNSFAWIDYNQNGVFDSLEYIPLTTNGNTGTATFTIPLTATPGLTGLRVRHYYGTILAQNACSVNGSYQTEDFVITIVQAPTCAGAPTAGTVSGPATACANSPFTLNLTGNSAGLGITLQWQSSTTGTAPWTNISGATNALYSTTTGVPVATSFRALVTCTNTNQADSSNVFMVGMSPFYLCYCSPITGTTLHTFGYNYLLNVTIPTTTLNNTSPQGVGVTIPGGYTQWWPTTTTNSASLTQGQIYTLQATAAYTGYPISAWVDYNGNGLFDSTEYVALAPNTAGTLYSGSFVFPLGGITGNTGIRLRLGYTPGYTSSQACFNYSSGYETEDYVVSVVAPPACSGTPTAGNSWSNGPLGTPDTTVCAGVSFQLRDTGYTVAGGITTQWQSGTSATGPFTDIANATSPYYTVVGGQIATTYYRLKVVCANSSSTVFSTPIKVGMKPFYTCYCSPLTGVTLHSYGYNYISNVSITSTSLNNATPTAPSNGYLQFYPTTSTTTATLNQGVQYTLNATALYSGYPIVGWMDYNGNGVMDSSEYIPLTASGTSYSGTFTIPTTGVSGFTGLRLRISYTPSYTATQACYNYSSGYETQDYVVNVLQASACNGTPSGGTAFAPSGVCLGNSFTLADTAYSVGSGISFQWQSKVGAGSWGNITGATNPTYIVTGQTVSTQYQMIVTCANSSLSSTSNAVSVVMNAPNQCYCTPGITSNTAGDQIVSVTFAGINKLTPNPVGVNGYMDYSATDTAVVGQGMTVPFAMMINNGGTEYGGLWIDWDQSGTFDTSEFVNMGSGQQPTFLTQNIVVPATATLGYTRMRVRSKYGSSLANTDPCAAYTYGETEDFTVYVTIGNNDASGAYLVNTNNSFLNTWYNNTTATQGASEPTASCASTSGFASVWFKFVAPASGAVRISTDTSLTTLADTRIALFSATNAGNYTTFNVISCDDNNGSSNRSILYATGLTAGTTYYVLVDGNSSTTGNFALAINPLNSSMLPTSGACAAGKGNTPLSTYTGWISLVDNSGKLIANAQPATGVTNGAFTESLNINIGAVRQAGTQYYLDRNYLITGPATGNFNVQYFFTATDLTAFQGVVPSATLAGLNITRQTGSTCQATYSTTNGTNTALIQTGSGSSNNANWVTVTTPGFSNFYVMSSIFPLAIDLKTITATNVGTRNRVDWTTGVEKAGDAFEVERSVDGRNFTYLASIKGKGEASTYS
ncbi:MAG: hypothetical protein JST88_11115, partial [Bacteroidetes bacterium]|nr:hypothetical protein [Bacteroidota bacterium]